MPRRFRIASAIVAASALLGTGVYFVANAEGRNAVTEVVTDTAVVEAIETTETSAPEPVVSVVEEATSEEPDDGRLPAPTSIHASMLTTEEMADLPRPVINRILPAGLPQVTPEDYQGFTAVPRNELTPGFADPNDAEPVIALESYTDTVIEPIAGAWAVTGFAGEVGHGWVQVMVPAGRGALPSQDPSLVNHHAVWVPETLVDLHEEPTRIEVNVADRLLRVVQGEDVLHEFHVGVGIPGQSDTPTGLCAVIGHIQTQAAALGLLTNCQSDAMDGYGGVDWAAFAIHQGAGFDPSTGGAVSNGCIRVPNQTFVDALSNINIGTPIIIS